MQIVPSKIYRKLTFVSLRVNTSGTDRMLNNNFYIHPTRIQRALSKI